MANRNARVNWYVCDEPWKVEELLIAELDLPLSLHQNTSHCFSPTLSELRRVSKVRARALPFLLR